MFVPSEELHTPFLTAAPIGNSVVSINTTNIGEEYAASFWITSMYGMDVQLLGNINLGFQAYDDEMAKRIIMSKLPQVERFISTIYDTPTNLPFTPPTAELKEQHAIAHIRMYDAIGKFDGLALSERTKIQVDICKEFKVKNLAKLIAEFEEVNIRTIHERIQRLKTVETPLSL